MWSLIVSVGHASAEVEFAGYMTVDGDVQVVLFDAEARKASGWLAIGQVFSGHIVQSFDAKREVITLERHPTTGSRYVGMVLPSHVPLVPTTGPEVLKFGQ